MSKKLRQLRAKIEELQPSCQFDLMDFFDENIDLVIGYLRKNTRNIKINDWEEVPDHWWYKQTEGLLRSGIRNKPFTVLQKLEWIKCGLSVPYFTKKYIKIISVDDGVIPFNLYDYQEKLLDYYANNQFVISMQCRQSGKTQTTAAFLTHFAIYKASKDIGVLAQLTGQAQEIVERMQMSYEQLPLFLQPGVRMWNKRSFRLQNKSRVVSYSSTSTSVRGKSFAIVYIDECAFLKNDMKFYESTYPTISSGKESRIIITSTPNGMRGLFYKLWSEAVEGLNSFKTIKVDWKQVPGRDEKWKKETIANTSAEQFRQEQELVFRGSENSMISGSILEMLQKKSPIETRDDGLKVFAAPVRNTNSNGVVIPGHEYILTVDVSRGLGFDYHAFSVVDISTSPHEVVCTYRNNTLSTMLYPSYIMNVAMQYNNAYVLVELNDIGEQVANVLYSELEYENTLTVINVNGRQKIGFDSIKMKPGVKTSKVVKSIGCSNAKTFIEKQKIHLNDEVLIDEFGTMVPNKGSYAADSGATDDLAMTIILYSWAMTQEYFVDLTNYDARRKLLEEARKEKEEDVMPFGFIESNEFGSFSEDTQYFNFNF